MKEVFIIKDKTGQVLIDEEKIKGRWKEYYDELLNIENEREELPLADPVAGPELPPTLEEVRESLMSMKSRKASGPSGITSDILKALGDEGISWIHNIIKDIWVSKQLPAELKLSTVIPIYKQKGDSMECGNYRGIKLLEHALKIIEGIVEQRLRKAVSINSIQYGFIPGRGTVDAVYIMRQIQEKTLEGNKKKYWAFVDLEKAFDRVPRDLIYWSLRKRGVTEELVDMIKAMYTDARTTVRCKAGMTEFFEVKVGVHQGSRLSPLLFIIVLDVISEGIVRDMPWNILYADDLVIMADTEEELQQRLLEWQNCLESKGLKVNTGKTEVMLCAKKDEPINVTDRHGQRLQQVTQFKYLGSTLETSGSSTTEVDMRIRAGWIKWKEITPVICDKKIPVFLKTKLYKTMIRPVMLYGAETWALRKREEEKLERTEMRMLRWIMGASLRDKLRNDYIRAELGVAVITDKVTEARLRWYGHVQRSNEFIKVAKDMKVTGKRSRGRQKLRWSDCVDRDMRARGLRKDDTQNRPRWRAMTKVADPKRETV
jgi:hypothetical protein